ncbi:MAG TPA: ABC transporter permease [Ignavibacteriales bacterium]|nr:ABC transporter permease [Ignavibacteriales bacterium]HOL81416.1 ABC transporter permease [Ignavibacteriales bacterium]HOM65530.1 ABC transporter permease [Ignavibacteriales bacterium]HPD68175.1 ABC transporter permease [Ignavibacteriales bacterium]HPP34354.1 ABC transporter permease [Ignavibacteriales bacterium]
MLNYIKIFLNAFKREVDRIVKDINIMTIIFLAPIGYAILYGGFYWNKTEYKVDIVVIDQDNSITSKQLLKLLNSHQNVNIKYQTTNYQEAKDKLMDLEVHGLVIIEKGFEEKLKKFQQAKIKLSLNTTRFLVSNDINKAVNEVVLHLTDEQRMRFYKNIGYTNEQAEELIEPIYAELRSLHNINETYGDFLLPGIFILILQQTLLIGLSESIAKEREENTLNEWFETSNNSVWVTIWGKAFFYFFNYLAYGLFYFGIVFYIFKIPINGSYIALFIISILYLLANIYFAFIISSLFKRKLVAIQFIAFTTYPIFLISGYSWPKFAMPEILQWISNLLPSTPYLNAVLRISLYGANFNDVLIEIFHIFLLFFIFMLLTKIRIDIILKTK